MLRGKGLVADEPTLIARSVISGKLLAIGVEAEDMIGRAGPDVELLKPLSSGVIADFSATVSYLKHLISLSIGRWHLSQPIAMITVQSGATSTEQRAVLDAGRRAGLKSVYLIPSGVASAIGAGLPIIEPSGHMIIDIGSESTEMAVLSLGGVVSRRSLRYGGQAINDVLIRTIKREHGLLIGQHTADDIKRLLVQLGKKQSRSSLRIRGRWIANGNPATLTLDTDSIRVYVESSLERLVSMARSIMEKTPPDLIADIIDNGLVLSGGGAMLQGIDHYLSQRLNVPCKVAHDPMLCGVKGAYLAMSNLNDYRRSLLGL
jgi:rod shape-determining protein MreB